jgi:membrane-bound serine protease (ClpP class)
LNSNRSSHRHGPFFCSIFFLFCAAHFASFVPASQASVHVFVIPVAGEVDPSLAAFIDRSLHEKKDGGENIYILEMDTFGGRVDSALQIVNRLLNVTDAKTIAYIKTKAISAGALIALSCNELAMHPHSTLGDCAPITYSSEGPKVMGEKFQSPLRAKFRTLAKRNGYPEVLAEAMVTADMEVYAVQMDDRTIYMDAQEFNELDQKEKNKVVTKKTIVARGELLTMDDEEARQLGFSRMTAATIEEMLAAMNIGPYEMTRIEKTWSERLSDIIAAIAPILMVIGLAALYTEIKAPGFGVPGLIGIISLGLVFLNQYLVGLAGHTELLFILIGIILLAFEVFVIPGFGIAGLGGLLSIAVGLILSLQNFIVPDPKLPWQTDLLTTNILHVLAAFVLALFVSMFIVRYLLPRFGTGVEGPYLGTTLADARAVTQDASRFAIGSEGVALTFLRPAGKARFGEEIIDVLSEGEYIDQGAPIIVKAIRGNHLIVAMKTKE